jgi:hypothetical protein
LEAQNAEFSMNDIECESAITAPLHLVPSREEPDDIRRPFPADFAELRKWLRPHRSIDSWRAAMKPVHGFGIGVGEKSRTQPRAVLTPTSNRVRPKDRSVNA